MEIALLIISILLIIIVLLQSSKSEDGPQIISGGQSELFSNRKERGSELVIILCYLFSFYVYLRT